MENAQHPTDKTANIDMSEEVRKLISECKSRGGLETCFINLNNSVKCIHVGNKVEKFIVDGKYKLNIRTYKYECNLYKNKK